MKLRSHLGQEGPPENKPQVKDKLSTWIFEVNRIIDLTEDEEKFFEERSANDLIDQQNLDIRQDGSSFIVTLTKEVRFDEFYKKRKKGIIEELKHNIDEMLETILSTLEEEFKSEENASD